MVLMELDGQRRSRMMRLDALVLMADWASMVRAKEPAMATLLMVRARKPANAMDVAIVLVDFRSNEINNKVEFSKAHFWRHILLFISPQKEKCFA